MEQARHQVSERRGIGREIGHEVQLPARQHDGDTVVANRLGHQHCIARLHVECAQAHWALQHADTRSTGSYLSEDQATACGQMPLLAASGCLLRTIVLCFCYTIGKTLPPGRIHDQEAHDDWQQSWAHH
jgi:hypothetical protein